MPQWLATLLVCAVTVLINLVTMSYYYGRLSQRVDSNEKGLDRVAGQTDRQWTDINDLRADMGKVKGKLGVNGA